MFISFKKIIYTALFLVFCSVSQHAFAENSIFLGSPTYEAYVGEIVTVDVFMSASDPINAVSAHINYDTNVLDLVSYRRTSEKISFWIENDNDPTDGSIVLEGLLIDQGWQGEREKLARIIFRVKKITVTDIGIENAALHAYDGTGNNIVDRVGHSSVNIISGTARAEYSYEQTGIPDVSENHTTNLLYADDYAREFKTIYIFPWWAWVFIGLSLGLFLWSCYILRKIQKIYKK